MALICVRNWFMSNNIKYTCHISFINYNGSPFANITTFLFVKHFFQDLLFFLFCCYLFFTWNMIIINILSINI